MKHTQSSFPPLHRNKILIRCQLQDSILFTVSQRGFNQISVNFQNTYCWFQWNLETHFVAKSCNVICRKPYLYNVLQILTFIGINDDDFSDQSKDPE